MHIYCLSLVNDDPYEADEELGLFSSKENALAYARAMAKENEELPFPNDALDNGPWQCCECIIDPKY